MATPMRPLLRSARGSLWEICIGLEVHAQVLSRAKLMSAASACASSAARANRQVAFYDAALPGTLPTINRECVHQAIRAGLAVGAQVHARSMFERKHYFYCDLPLGYQVTQQRAPIATNGMLQFEMPLVASAMQIGGNDDAVFRGSLYKTRKEKNAALQEWKAARRQQQHETSQPQSHNQREERRIRRKVRIQRIQLEQDSGKSLHDVDADTTLVDLNRAGVALLEIVMAPDLQSPMEAGCVVKQLQHLLRHLGICDGNMDEGSMRCDLNVSVRRAGGAEAESADTKEDEVEAMGERVEVKNMNSIRNIVRAAEYEAHRQIEYIESTGKPIERETRTFDAATGETRRMRSKEGITDYRFMPEPDLPPLVVLPSVIASIRAQLPELPQEVQARLCATYGLSPAESEILVHEPGATAFFERIARISSPSYPRPAKLVANWILNELFGHLKAANTTIEHSPVSPDDLGELVDLMVDGTISGKIAKDVLEIMVLDRIQHCGEQSTAKPLSAREIVEAKRWQQIQDEDEIRRLCRAVLGDKNSRKNLDAYRNGKTQLLGYFIGQVMKASNGRVHPERADRIMRELLIGYCREK